MLNISFFIVRFLHSRRRPASETFHSSKDLTGATCMPPEHPLHVSASDDARSGPLNPFQASHVKPVAAALFRQHEREHAQIALRQYAFGEGSGFPGLDAIESDRCRAELVFFETPSGGAVFSTGSIGWSSSLAHNKYDNNVSRITLNVLRRFLDPKAFS